MKIKHEIDKKRGIVTVTASLEPRNGMKRRITQQHIKDYLNKEKIKISKCVKDCCVVNTIAPYSGDWIFELDSHKTSMVKSMNENIPTPEEELKAETPKPRTLRRKTRAKKED